MIKTSELGLPLEYKKLPEFFDVSINEDTQYQIEIPIYDIDNDSLIYNINISNPILILIIRFYPIMFLFGVVFWFVIPNDSHIGILRDFYIVSDIYHIIEF